MKIIVDLSRTIKAGFIGFSRNGLLTIATISIISLNLTVVGGVLLFSIVTNGILETIENKIDISIYFKEEVSEEDILIIKDSFKNIPEIKSVEYISKDRALEEFKNRRQNQKLVLEALEELEINPLSSALNIKAKSQSDFPKIIEYFENPEFKKITDSISYYENEKIISKLNIIISTVKNIGAGLSLILSIIAIFITFSTIKLAIHSLREEISIMRLVGATNWYIRGPFIIEGFLYGLISAIISIIILYPLVKYGSVYIKTFLGDYDLFYYFKTNLLNIFTFLSGIGILLGTLSSIVAIRKYLKV